MGRDNMIISESRDSWKEELKFEQFEPILDYCSANLSDECLSSVINLLSLLRVLFPTHPVTQFVLTHICVYDTEVPNLREKIKRLVHQCLGE